MPTRILLVSDNQRDPRSRAAEHDRVMDFVADLVENLRPDAVAHGGDWTERASTHADRDYLFGWVQRVTDVCPLVTVQGNHEESEFCSELERLDTRWSVVAATSPRVANIGGAAWGLVPWPRRASIVQWCASRGIVGSEGVNAASLELLRDLMRGIGAELDVRAGDLPRFGLGHFMVKGGLQGPDQPVMPGCDFEVGLEDLDLMRCDFVGMGHLHMGQAWTLPSGAPAVYPASPRRTSYAKGELEPKGVVLVTFDGRTPRWERIATPATEMRLVELTWDGAGFAGPVFGVETTVAGAEIRCRYTVQSDQRQAARAAAASMRDSWLSAGAAEVRVEEIVLPSTRARAPEVAAAVTVREKLGHVLAARGVEGERAERVLAVAGEIEEVVR